ncbi:hypothetical protein Btru_000605 [Bulinus truncatus]|nr:hypothetical protein Btru_000605 [Bulinus truncatus]
MLFDDSIEKDAAIGGTIILTELVRINGKEGNLTVTTNGLLTQTVKSKQTAGIHLNWPEVICIKSVNKKSETGVFIIHYIHHGAKNILQVKTLKIAESSEQWINIVNQGLKATQRPKKLFVVINPIGGAVKGQQIYNKTVEPLFRLAEIKTSVVVTERSKQALEIGECTDFSQYDGIVVIGGDGLYQEILQGLSLQEQKKTGINYDNFEEDLSKLSLPIGIIPAGTGNGFTQFINGALDVTTAALNIIRGEQYRANIFAVYSNNKFLCVSGFMFGYGMFTSSMKRAEELRWMKQFRYAVVISEFLFKKRILFQGELHYRLCGEKTSELTGASSSPSGWIRHEPANQFYRCVYAVPCELMDKGNRVLINPFGPHFQLGVAMNCHWLTVVKGLSTFAMGKKISSKPGSLELIDEVTDFKVKITRENQDSNARASNRDARNREQELILLIDGEIVYLENPKFVVRLQTGFVPVYGPNLGRVHSKVQKGDMQ